MIPGFCFHDSEKNSPAYKRPGEPLLMFAALKVAPADSFAIFFLTTLQAVLLRISLQSVRCSGR